MAVVLSQVPSPALWLTVGGVVPFAALAAGVWLLDGPAADLALQAQLAYAAVILSFVGAIHWGMALFVPAERTWTRFLWSIAPAIVGWMAQFMVPAPALILVMLMYWTSFVVDARSAGAGLLPAWYVQLRRPVVAAVVVCLAATLLAVWT